MRGRRTVSQLVAAARARAEARRREEAEREAMERARREREAAAARAKYLDGLSGRVEKTWQQVDGLIATKRPGDYDRAVALLKDLRDLAARDGRADEFKVRVMQLRSLHAKKPSLLERFRDAGL